jgi:hypothetical protein
MLAAFAICSLPGLGQSAPTAKPSILDKMDFGLTYSYKWVKISTTNGPEHGIQGGSVDAVYNIGGKYKGLGIAIDASGDSASALNPGVDLSQFTIVAGPRYTVHQTKADSPKATGYVQALVGYVHAFDSVFPSTPPAPGGTYSVLTTSNSVALQLGGGFSLPITKHFGYRVAELDYIYTRLGNNNNNFQNDIRLTTGLTVHF